MKFKFVFFLLLLILSSSILPLKDLMTEWAREEGYPGEIIIDDIDEKYGLLPKKYAGIFLEDQITIIMDPKYLDIGLKYVHAAIIHELTHYIWNKFIDQISNSNDKIAWKIVVEMIYILPRGEISEYARTKTSFEAPSEIAEMIYLGEGNEIPNHWKRAYYAMLNQYENHTEIDREFALHNK
jgi:hypothetical protein